MLESIKNILLGKTDDLQKKDVIADSNKIAVATCALLLEMAYADSEFSHEENENILNILKESYNLNEEDAVQLMEIASIESKDGIDLWQFTNTINNNYSKENKLKVAETLWKVVYADGKIDKHEEYLMRKLTYLLNLSHNDMIQSKLNAKPKI